MAISFLSQSHLFTSSMMMLGFTELVIIFIVAIITGLICIVFPVLLCLWIYKRYYNPSQPVFSSQPSSMKLNSSGEKFSSDDDFSKATMKIFEMRDEGKITAEQSHELLEALYRKPPENK